MRSDKFNIFFQASFIFRFIKEKHYIKEKHKSYIKEKHQKKLDAIIVNKTTRDGIKKNPNSIITNLTDKELTENEISRPKASGMIVIAEDIWDQILRNNVLKQDHISKQPLQTALKLLPTTTLI